MNFTGEMVANAVVLLLGIALEIIPGLREKWETWPWQKAVLAGGALFVAVAAVVLCGQGIDLGFACPEPLWPTGVWAALQAAAEALGFLVLGGLSGYFGRHASRWTWERLRAG